MPVLPILEIGAPGLRVSATDVEPSTITTPEIQDHIQNLIDTMRAVNGSGLAATQVGLPLDICVMEVTHNPRYPYKPSFPLTVMINAQWKPLGNETFSNFEGCLSVPGLRGRVNRFRRIQVAYIDQDGKPCTRTLVGLRAGTVQHELDHLRGTLFTDSMADTESMTTWENFKAFHQEGWLAEIADVIQEEQMTTEGQDATEPLAG